MFQVIARWTEVAVSFCLYDPVFHIAVWSFPGSMSPIVLCVSCTFPHVQNLKFRITPRLQREYLSFLFLVVLGYGVPLVTHQYAQ